MLWIALTLLTNLPDPYYFLIVQSYVIKLNRENGGEPFIDCKLTAKNRLAIAAGIVANVVVLIMSSN